MCIELFVVCGRVQGRTNMASRTAQLNAVLDHCCWVGPCPLDSGVESVVLW